MKKLMATSYTPKERTSDAIKDGFDNDPVSKRVEGSDILIVYRAHGDRKSASNIIGRFFFTPWIAETSRSNWTAEMLERELNAALWGNDFKYLATFRVREKVEYNIGPIAHDQYQGIERNFKGNDIPFDQYSYFRNANLFAQVEIPAITRENWKTYLDLIEDKPIKTGRFHRFIGRC